MTIFASPAHVVGGSDGPEIRGWKMGWGEERLSLVVERVLLGLMWVEAWGVGWREERRRRSGRE